MIKTQIKEKIKKSQLIELYKAGEKRTEDFKLGLEYERVPIFRTTEQEADYSSDRGICNFLRKIAKNEGWDYIVDNTNGNLIGLKFLHDTITLEPGCQVEYSIKPEKTIKELKEKVEKIDDIIGKYLSQNKIELLNYGISPLTTYHSIKLIPKKRYHIMAKYMWGILSDVMMRETAGIQCGIDFKNQEDMAKKFNLANKISPFITAMYANSPIRGGVDTGYKSFRALSWLNTDNDRCGFANEFEKDFTYEKYVDTVLKTPMIFINREDETIEINGKINFEEFIEKGYEGFDATIEDFMLQANLYFPEVRLRNFIEIRNHDCVNKKLMWSIFALYKGLMYNENAIEETENLLCEFSYENLSELRYSIPKYALDAKIKMYKVFDIAKEIIKIAEKSLKEILPEESKYLDEIKELTYSKLTPADIILKNWYGVWNKDIDKLIRYVKN